MLITIIFFCHICHFAAIQGASQYFLSYLSQYMTITMERSRDAYMQLAPKALGANAPRGMAMEPLDKYINAMNRASKPKHDYQFIRRVSPTTDDVVYSIEWPDYTPHNKKLAELNTAIDDFIGIHGIGAKFTVEIDDVALECVKYSYVARYNIIRSDGYLRFERRPSL